MSKLSSVIAAALLVSVALAGQPGNDYGTQPPPAAPPQAAPAPTAPERPATLAEQEQVARTDATLSLIRLETILARKAWNINQHELAARKAVRVLNLVKQLPPAVDASDYELQAEGILAKAARAHINVDRLRRDAELPPPDQLPEPSGDQQLGAKTREAARIAREHQGTPTPDMDTSGNERVLRERALAHQTPDKSGYHPASEIIDQQALDVRERERIYYQGALENAYKESEQQQLTAVDESRVIPPGEITYPPNWPEIVRKRAQYRGGMIARGPSFYDKDGREWYMAVYDIHDLIYVPPDFPAVEFNPIINQRNAQDRAALQTQSYIFRGGAEDLAAGLPLLQYFGGVDPYALRGPKYSIEREKQIVEMIKAFTGPQPDGAKIIELPPLNR